MLLPLSANLYKISNSLSMIHDCQSLCMCIRSILIYGLKYRFFNNFVYTRQLKTILRIFYLRTFFWLQIKFVSLTTQRQLTKSGATHSSVASRSPRNVTKASALNLIIYSKIKISMQKYVLRVNNSQYF